MNSNLETMKQICKAAVSDTRQFQIAADLLEELGDEISAAVVRAGDEPQGTNGEEYYENAVFSAVQWALKSEVIGGTDQDVADAYGWGPVLGAQGSAIGPAWRVVEVAEI